MSKTTGVWFKGDRGRDQRGLIAAAGAGDLRRRGCRAGQGTHRPRARAPAESAAPKVCELLEEAEEDLIAFYGFPAEHWSKLKTTDENVKGFVFWTCSDGRSRLVCGRGRSPSEEQDVGLFPAAQLAPLRALRVAPRWWRPRPPCSVSSLASRRRACGMPALPVR